MMVTDVDECNHRWVAGMMIVHPEDVAYVASVRPVECLHCEQPYSEGDM